MENGIKVVLRSLVVMKGIRHKNLYLLLGTIVVSKDMHENMAQVYLLLVDKVLLKYTKNM